MFATAAKNKIKQKGRATEREGEKDRATKKTKNKGRADEGGRRSEGEKRVFLSVIRPLELRMSPTSRILEQPS